MRLPNIGPRVAAAVVVLALVVGIPLLGASLIATGGTRSNPAANGLLRETARQAAARTATTLQAYCTLATYIAGLNATHAALGLDSFALVANPFDDQAQALFVAYPHVSGLYLTSPSGTVLRGSALLAPGTLGPVPYLPAGTPLPSLTRAAAQPAYALAPADAAAAGSPGDLWVAAPVLDQHITRGLVLLRVDAAEILPLAPAGPGEGISLQMVAGGAAFGGTPSAISPATLSALRVGQPAAITVDGRPTTAVTAAVPGSPGWRLIAFQPAGTAPGRRSAPAPVVLAGALIAVALLLGVWAALTLAMERPIARLRRTVDRWGEGHLDEAAPPAGQGEMGALVTGVDALRRRLQQDAAEATARADALTHDLQHFTQALEPLAQGQLHRRIPLLADPDSPLLDAVEATNHLVRRLRRLIAGLKNSVHDILDSSTRIRARINDAAIDASRQQEQLEHQRHLVAALSDQAHQAGRAAEGTAEASEQVNASVQRGNQALVEVTGSFDHIYEGTLENTNRITTLQSTAATLTSLVDHVLQMATVLGLLAYNGLLTAEQSATADPAFARLADETAALATSFDRTLQEITTCVDQAQRDIDAAIHTNDAVAHDIFAAQRARDALAGVFAQIGVSVARMRESAAGARAQAAEQARLADAVREGNDLVAQAYERIRQSLDQAVDEMTLRAGDLDRLSGSMADLQVESPPTVTPQTGPLTAA